MKNYKLQPTAERTEVMKSYLAFEAPIKDLDIKIHEIQQSNISEDEKNIKIEKLKNETKTLQKQIFQNLTNWQKIELARHPDRPYTSDYIHLMTDNFLELHGDRYLAEDSAIVSGLATIEDQKIILIGHQKGRNVKERQKRNFGMASPAGYRKALRMMHLAEKFNKPILILIDTPGANPSVEAEKEGQAKIIAQNIQSSFQITVPIIAIVIGEGASGGALALAIADQIAMLEYTWYSVISPESCSSILWKSWNYKTKAAEILQPTAQDMLKHKLIDQIIKEPLGGAHRNHQSMSKILKDYILKHIWILKQVPKEKLIQDRMKKFCSIDEHLS